MTPNKLVETSIAKIDTSHCKFVPPAFSATVDKKNPNHLYLNWRDCDKFITHIPPSSGLEVYEMFIKGGESMGLEQKINYPDPESPIPGFLGVFGNDHPRRFIINDYGVDVTQDDLFVGSHQLIDMQNLYTLPTQVLNVILRRYITFLTPKARALVWDWSSIGSIISYKEAKEVYNDL